MTLTTQIQRWEYLGDGVSTEFAYNARVDISTDMVAVIDGVSGTIGYSVTGLGDDNGGLVIFNTPPADQANIALERLVPLQQTTDYPVRGPFPAKDHEGTLDRIVMMLQQQRTALLDVYGYLGIGNGGGTIYPLGGQVPKGLIAEWAGIPSTIPSGWFLCDGLNGTPDLSGRFVVCLDEDGTVFNNVGEIGGENEVVLTTNQMPNHEHDITPVDAVVLSFPGSSSTTGGSQLQASLSVDGVTGHSQAIGVAEAHNNVPVYYTLAYIQYQGGESAPSFIGTFPNQTFSDDEIITPINMSTEFFVGDGTNPIYTATGLPTGITIDPVSGIISGTVDSNASASSPYSVVVTLTTSINPPATSFPDSIWTIVAGSTLVTWQAGGGAPVIDGPTWSTVTSDSSVYDPTASTIDTVDSDTGQYYAEYLLVIAGVGTDRDEFGFGWNLQSAITNLTRNDMIGVWWYESLAEWRTATDLDGPGTTVAFDVQPTSPPADGMVFGVALDCLANKMYIQVDGAWMTTAGATAGGAPAGGLGWDIVDATNIAVLFSYCQADNQIMRAVNPSYTPAGYTPVT
jgi:microcystin-dependent protein